MALPEKRITNFIKQHHIFTLATVSKDGPWCCTCFYSFNEEDMSLIFLTDDHTRHATEMLANPTVAGTIALETKIIGKIRGIQLTGKIILMQGHELSKAKQHYLLKFPFALLTKTQVWKLKIDHIKMTDNRLGFGKKISWNSEK